jgi:hypothetical protein
MPVENCSVESTPKQPHGWENILAFYVIPNKLIINTPMELFCIQSETATTLTKIAIVPAMTDFFNICSGV